MIVQARLFLSCGPKNGKHIDLTMHYAVYIYLYLWMHPPLIGSRPWFSHLPVLQPVQRKRHHWKDVLDEATVALARTEECFRDIEGDPVLDYRLPPRRGMLAGGILKHCYSALDSILMAQYPCIFKVGYTHNPTWRFHNKIYGYGNDVAKWSNMVVLYAASETISPSYIEAALIQRHKGPLNAIRFAKLSCTAL